MHISRTFAEILFSTAPIFMLNYLKNCSAAMGKEQALKHMRECDDSSSSSSSASSAQHQSLGAQLKSLFSCSSSSSSKNGDDDIDQVSGGSASNNSNASNSAANRLVLKPESPARQLWCSGTVESDAKGGIMPTNYRECLEQILHFSTLTRIYRGRVSEVHAPCLTKIVNTFSQRQIVCGRFLSAICTPGLAVSLLLSIYYLCIVPFRIGFMTAVSGSNANAAVNGSIWFDCVADAFFLVDAWLRLTRFAVMVDGALVVDAAEVRALAQSSPKISEYSPKSVAVPNLLSWFSV